MISSNDSRFTRITVDGQEMLVPSEDLWKEILESPFIDGIPTHEPRHLQIVLDDIRPHSELMLALGKIRLRNEYWVDYTLLNLDGIWHRVQFCLTHCYNCDYKSLAAHAWTPDIYFGANDEEGCFQLACDTLPRCRCPKCGGGLYDGPVWLANTDGYSP